MPDNKPSTSLDPKQYSAVVKSRSGTLRPDFVNSIALRNVTREDAAAAGWSCYYVPEPCRYGHVAARFTKNTACVDCWRVKAGRDPLYPRAKDKKYYQIETPAQKAAAAVSAAPVIVAPAKPLEPSKKEQDFLAALAMTGDFDGAAQSVNMTRGQVEARASVDPVFKAALTDLCERQDIPWTRAPSTTFQWTPENEKQLASRFIDTGLLAQARTELGISASDYQTHLTDSPDFAAMIEEARAPARETLRERALHAAATGNDRLLKALEDDPSDYLSMVGGQKVRRTGDPAEMRDQMTQLLTGLKRDLLARERLREVCVSRVAAIKPDHNIEVIENE